MTKAAQDLGTATGAPAPASPGWEDILAHASDMSLTLSREGIVLRIRVNPDSAQFGRLDHWVGRDIRDFLTIECHPKIDARLKRDAAPSARPIELNHHDNAAWEFPVRYTVHETGTDEVLLLGRDMRPYAELQQKLVREQVARERDYERYRGIETRFRMVMDSLDSAIVLVEAETGRIATLNPAAAQLLGSRAETLTGTAFAQAFEGSRTETLETLKRRAGSEAGEPVEAQTRRNAKPLLVYPRLFRAAGELTLLCKLYARDESAGRGARIGEAMTALYNNASDAIVFTDAQGQIGEANEGFLALCDAPQLRDVRGRSLGEFLVRGEVDLKLLLESAARAGHLRSFASQMQSVVGPHVSVEIAGTELGDHADPRYAFIIRDTSRPADDGASPGPAMSDEAMQSVMDLVGTAPLKELVSATTDVVEKMCIETAVRMTGNNRAAAAEMLGLSRQSLYVKLRKYGLQAPSGEE